LGAENKRKGRKGERVSIKKANTEIISL